MCILDLSKGIYIASEYDAREFLSAGGIIGGDQEEFLELLGGGEMRDKYEDLQEEFAVYERALDAAQGALNDVLVLCDELKSRARTQEARKLLQTVYEQVYNCEAI